MKKIILIAGVLMLTAGLTFGQEERKESKEEISSHKSSSVKESNERKEKSVPRKVELKTNTRKPVANKKTVNNSEARKREIMQKYNKKED